MFIAGLHEKIQSKVFKSGDTTHIDIYKKAVEIETIKEDKKVKVSTTAVTAVSYKDTEPSNTTNADDMDNDELIRFPQMGPPAVDISDM